MTDDRRPRRCALIVVLGLAVVACQGPGDAAVGAGRPEGQAAVTERLQEKARRTPAQQKISSRLLDAIKHEIEAPAGEPPRPRSGIDLDSDGRALVDIDGEVTEAVLAEITRSGGTVVSKFPQYQAIRARIRLNRIETLAELPEVKFIRPAGKAILRPSRPSSERPPA